MVTLNEFVKTREYRRQRDVVVFRFCDKICVMGLWGNCFLASREFNDMDDAIDGFRYLRFKFPNEERRVKELWRF